MTCIGISIITAAVKNWYIPFAAFILLTTFSVLIIIYLIKGFTSFRIWKTSKSITLFRFSLYLILSLALLPILFAINLWQQFSTVPLFLAVSLLILVIIFSGVHALFKNKQYFLKLWSWIKSPFLRAIGIIALGIILNNLSEKTLYQLFSPHSKNEIENRN